MMVHMTDDHISQRAGADRRTACASDFGKGGVFRILNHTDGGMADGFEFIEQARKWKFICHGLSYEIILLEAGQGGLILTRDAQEPIRKNPFDVYQMRNDFFDGPFRGSGFEARLSVR